MYLARILVRIILYSGDILYTFEIGFLSQDKVCLGGICLDNVTFGEVSHFYHLKIYDQLDGNVGMAQSIRSRNNLTSVIF